MEKNDIIEIRITDMTSEGAGIGRAADGTAVFVDGAVLGDLAEARVTKLKKN